MSLVIHFTLMQKWTQKFALHNETYLSIGIMWTTAINDLFCLLTMFFFLSNNFQRYHWIQKNVKWHFVTNHIHMKNNRIDHFETLLESQNKQRQHFCKKLITI